MVIEIGYPGSANSNGELLRSDDHDNCHSIVLLNPATNEAQMLHVWEAAFEGLYLEQEEAAKNFVNRADSVIGQVIEGDRSIMMGDDGKGLAQEYLESLGVEFPEQPIALGNKQKKWNAEFDPKSHNLQICDTHGKEL